MVRVSKEKERKPWSGERKWSKGRSSHFGGRRCRNDFENRVVSIGTDNKSDVMWLEAPSGGLYVMCVA